MMLITSDYNQKIASLLKDKAYKNLRKDLMHSVEHKTGLLLKKSPFADIMVSFDAVSLFTRVPIKKTVDLLGRHF
jgi:hypothetical protein